MKKFNLQRNYADLTTVSSLDGCPSGDFQPMQGDARRGRIINFPLMIKVGLLKLNNPKLAYSEISKVIGIQSTTSRKYISIFFSIFDLPDYRKNGHWKAPLICWKNKSEANLYGKLKRREWLAIPRNRLKTRLVGRFWMGLFIGRGNKNHSLHLQDFGIDPDKIIDSFGELPEDIENYQIDHIIPIRKFNLKKLSQIKKAFAISNTQLITKKEHGIKTASDFDKDKSPSYWEIIKAEEALQNV